MSRHKKWLIVGLVSLAFLLPIAYGALKDQNFAILNPKGNVAAEQKELIIVTVLLGLLVVIPVYVLTFVIAWRYREGNKKAKYSPDLVGNPLLEAVWWAIPLAIISVLSVITWRSSHTLDPRQPLTKGGQPLTVQVVALQWKWLFIYPSQGVASVNHLKLPVGRQVEFAVTADAPMNSFWIPQLGSQIYAMPGMTTKLHLMADELGSYRGSSANLSGAGFARMNFEADAVSSQDFSRWVSRVSQQDAKLDSVSYHKLARPSVEPAQTDYQLTEKELYHSILMKYAGAGN